jgi:hypothetical protein
VNDKTISDLNAVLKYTADADILRKQLATDPEHLKPGSTLRLIAADAHEEAGDKAFADYLRSKFPLGVDNGKVKRSTLRLHRLLTTLDDRHRHSLTTQPHPPHSQRLNDPVNAEAIRELEKVGRHREAAILKGENPVAYRDGVVQGDYDAYQWPGGNQLVYHTQDGGTLCPECRNGLNGSDALDPEMQTDPQWTVTGVSAHDEGPPIHCDHCNKPLIATYGDPDNPEDDQ